jgi:glycosyltransferase involved in cell wall biosynthesis
MAPEKVSTELGDWEVIHISTGHEGGAGLAARRLNAALNAKHIKSKFVALENSRYSPGNQEFCLKRTFWQKLVSGTLTRIQTKISKRVFFSIFSVNILTINKLLNLAETNNPIIHIHNWFNIISQKQIIKFLNAGIPIVLTMHDQRIFTGGCHYSFECQGFQKNCNECPILAAGLKHWPSRVIAKAKRLPNSLDSNFQLIAPSKWMLEQAKKSTLVGSSRIHFVPNTLDVLPKSRVKSRVNKAPSGVLEIGIASMNKDSYIKGGDIITDLESKIAGQKLPINLTFLSDESVQMNPVGLFWDKIDYLLVPSRADNSPNVIHEAKHYGVAVIATLVGGIPELLHASFDIGIPESDLNADFILSVIAAGMPANYAVHLPSMTSDFNKYVGESVNMHLKVYSEILA